MTFAAPVLPFLIPYKVVGILSQGNQFGAYVMGISTAKTLLSASTLDAEAIFTEDPVIRLWEKMWKAHNTVVIARAAAARAAAKAAAANSAANAADT